MKTDNIRQNTTKQDERVKEGKQKIDNIKITIDNISLKTNKKLSWIYWNRSKSTKNQSESMLQKQTKVEKLKAAWIRPQISKDAIKLTTNWQKIWKNQHMSSKNGLKTLIFTNAFKNTYKYTFSIVGQPQLRRWRSIFHMRMKKFVS